jgi:hypothetical protein
MTDDLKDQLRHLVADPPPPTGVPSEAVFARIRTARRRRTAGVAAGAAAAVVAVVAVATSTFAGPNSAPPITNTPGRPQTIVTGPPTITPSETPPSSKSTVTAPVVPTNKSDSPPPSGPSSPSDTKPPAAQPVKVNLSLTPTVKGLTASVKYDWSGSLLIPINTFTGKTLESGSSRLSDLAYIWDYDFGDGTYEPATGKNGGGLTCKGATERAEGTASGKTETHTYKKAGTYTFSYVIHYCAPEGERVINKTETLVITAPAAPTTPPASSASP